MKGVFLALQICAVSAVIQEGVEPQIGYTTFFRCSRALRECQTIDPSRERIRVPGKMLWQFSLSHVTNMCRYVEQLVTCDRYVKSIPGCDSYGFRGSENNASSTFLQIFCRGQGRTDIESLVPCANNKELQLSVYSYYIQTMGYELGMKTCPKSGTESRQLICDFIQIGVRKVLREIPFRCGRENYDRVMRIKTLALENIDSLLSEDIAGTATGLMLECLIQS